MKTWVKATLGVTALVLLAMLALAGTGAYFVLNSLDRKTAVEAEADKQVGLIRARFSSRSPLVEVVGPRRADIRINRQERDSAARPSTVHVVNWKAQTNELIQMEAPLWLMRFSSLNLLSQLGVAPEKFRLTVEDIQRYGPGIIVDYNRPGEFRVLVWVD